MVSNITRKIPALALALALLIQPGASHARVADYPYLDNETLGLFNLISDALAGPVEQFDVLYWGDITLEKTFGSMLGFTRYLVAASSYAVAAAAQHSPAYRAPYKLAFERAVAKMLHHRSWNDWLEVYGDDPIAKDNLMFKGFLFYMMVQYQALFGDRRYEQPVKMQSKQGKTFSTDLRALASLLATEQANKKDILGNNHHNICCEPGQVFVMCNTQHRVAFEIYDRMQGTSHGASVKIWISWLRKNMVDPKSGLFYFMYRPEKSADKQLIKTLSGLYIGISIAFIDALDHAWVDKELYPKFKKMFLQSDAASPHGAGTTVAVDQLTQKSDLITFALNIATTGLTMIMARSAGETALYDRLVLGLNGYLGKPSWEPDKSRYGYTFMRVVPLVFQNVMPLWARASDLTHNIRLNTRASRTDAFFKQPHLAAVGNNKTFVNQAVYDSAKATLVLTVNGGLATTEATTLSVAGLDPKKYYDVTLDGAAHEAVAWQGDRLVITTPPLSATEASYMIKEGTAPVEPPLIPPADEGCQVGGAATRGPTSALSLLLLLALAGRLRGRALRNRLT